MTEAFFSGVPVLAFIAFLLGKLKFGISCISAFVVIFIYSSLDNNLISIWFLLVNFNL